MLRRVKTDTGYRNVCHECRTKSDICSFCKKAGNGDVELLRDGRRVCDPCKGERIFRQDQLDRVYAKVKDFLRDHPAGLLLSDPPPLYLADKDEILTKQNEHGRVVADLSGFYSPAMPEEIYILSGALPWRCASTVVHEYTHAWQSRNCPPQDRALKEGFASWVQYHFLISINLPREPERLTRRSNPDYGESLKKLLEMEDELGPEGVIQYAKTAQALPSKP